jgi:hypothetical protein
MAWKTSNVGVVKHPVKASNNRRNEMGRLTPGSIDGSLSATTVVQAPSMLPSSHPKITHSQATRRVTPTADPPPKTAKVEFISNRPVSPDGVQSRCRREAILHADPR